MGKKMKDTQSFSSAKRKKPAKLSAKKDKYEWQEMRNKRLYGASQKSVSKE